MRVQFQLQLARVRKEKKLDPHAGLKRSNDVLGQATKIQLYYGVYRVHRHAQSTFPEAHVYGTTLKMLKYEDPMYFYSKTFLQMQEELEKKYKSKYKDFSWVQIIKIYTDKNEAKEHVKRLNEARA